MKWFKIGILFLITLFIFLAFLIETPVGRRFVGSMIVNSLNRSGLNLEIGEIKGSFPQTIDLTDVKLPGLSIQTLHLELSLLPLLAGQIQITKLQADQIVATPTPSQGEGSRQMPLSLSIRHYQLDHVQWEGSPLFATEGSASIGRKGHAIKAQGTLTRYDVPDALFSYEISRTGTTKGEGFFKLTAGNLDVLKPWIVQDQFEGNIELAAHLQGTPNAFSGTLEGNFETWSFKGRVKKELGQPIEIPKLILSTQGLRVSGSIVFDDTYAFKKSVFNSRVSTHFFSPQTRGTLFLNAIVENTESGLTTQASWTSGALKIYDVPIQNTSGSIAGQLNSSSFRGDVTAKADYANAPWTLQTKVFADLTDSVTLQDFQLDADPLSMQGTVTLSKKAPHRSEEECPQTSLVYPLFPHAFLVGDVQFEHANLSLFQRYVSGIAEGNLSFFVLDDLQRIHIDATAKSLVYGTLSADSLQLMNGDNSLFLATLQHVKWKKLILDTALLDINPDQFTLDVNGQLLQLYLTGKWDLNGILIETADGRFLQHRAHFLAPTQLAWGRDRFSLDRLYLTLGSGTFDGQWNYANDTTDANIQASDLPLNILSFNPMQSEVLGTFSAQGKLHKDLLQTDADWNAKIENGVLDHTHEILYWEGDPPTPLTLSGQTTGSLHKDLLKLQTDISLKDNPFYHGDLETHLHVNSEWEPTFPQGQTTGHIRAHGKLEDLLDFLDLGMHRMAGAIDCDLSFARGTVEGACTIQEGYYQNYVTGTELSGIQARLEGQGRVLHLNSLTANDLNNTQVLTGKGHILLSLQERFPYHIEAHFDKLAVMQIDLLTAHAKGNVSIDGNLGSAVASGGADITRSEVTIPTHIPRSFPDLQVIYKHRPITPPRSSQPKLPFPLHLDFAIDAPSSVFINGRGLNSEWSGNFSVNGTYTEPSITGRLELIEGDFSFGGKRFKLTQGSLAMQGDSYQLPLIDITGTTTEQAILITARIKGPINSPQLTFQSLPPLPLSAILSHLLFGKDLSDVTGLQALQLAGTVAAVAGEGPDILEITRKSLGVDRLQIVMTPTKSGDGYEGKETIALEVGKILTPGVILTIKQSASYTNPDIGIEADLLHGFVIEVQSQQQPEQGKFSLKWNLNY